MRKMSVSLHFRTMVREAEDSHLMKNISITVVQKKRELRLKHKIKKTVAYISASVPLHYIGLEIKLNKQIIKQT